jgi:hypothetical protein
MKPVEKLWTFAAAAKAVPYVRPMFVELRINFILVWHLYKQNGYVSEGGPHEAELKMVGDRGRQLLSELNTLGVLPYYSPMRGIGLFQFLVNAHGWQRKAYYVYKDSRDCIDTYIFHDEFIEYADLYGYERRVPDQWKTAGVTPTLEEIGL